MTYILIKGHRLNVAGIGAAGREFTRVTMILNHIR